MDLKQFYREMDRDNLQGIYLCQVTEPYLWDLLKAGIQKGLLAPGTEDFNLELLSAGEMTYDQFTTAVNTLPLFSKYRLVILQDLLLDKAGVSKMEQPLKWLAAYAKNPAPKTLLFLVYRGEKPFKSKYWKAVEGLVTPITLFRLKEPELNSFIANRLHKEGVRASRETVNYLIEASGYLKRDADETLYVVENLLTAAIGTAKEGVLSEEAVRDLVHDPVEDNIFKLMDAINSRNLSLALHLLRGFFTQRGEERRYYYMLIRQLRNMIGVKLLSSRRYPPREGRQKLGISEYEYKKLLGGVRNYSSEELVRAHGALSEIEFSQKSRPTNLPLEMERFLCGFLGH